MTTTHTSESVTEGHPDKVADRTSDAQVDIEAVVRRVIADIGYTDPALGFAAESCRIEVIISRQSANIARGVNLAAGEIGAGDQGLMFGYATDASSSHLPLTLHLAHRLDERLAAVRHAGVVDWLRPDGKTQVTVSPEEPHTITHVLVSAQHADGIGHAELTELVHDQVIEPVLAGYEWSDAEVLVNPTGQFVGGGPAGDAGLTGRKIIVDTYGGEAHHGGGAFSGKDPTKVDRTGAYALRKLALDIVRRGYARRCEVQASYAIGRPAPLRIGLDTFGTELCDVESIRQSIDQCDLRVAAIIERLDLRRPIYEPTATYGHFGRPEFPWEQDR